MITTVSTVKDSLANVRRFVDANIASGVDHMFVFLDARDAPVEEWLRSRDDVTVVVTDKDWWNGARPRLLNKRQRVNANLVKAILATLQWDGWLVHIDADEVARIDREALAAVPAGTDAIRLPPLEVISKMDWDQTPTVFKRLLSEPELDLLFALGLLEQPTNSLYFRSHIAGKVGVRPRLDVSIGIHKATDRRDRRIEAFHHPAIRVLHYESYSGEDFVRKWKAMIGSGPSIHFGEHRQKLAMGMKSLLESDLSPEVTERYLREIYVRHMIDPVDQLRELGLLEDIDPLAEQRPRQPLDPVLVRRIEDHLDGLRPIDKRVVLPETSKPREVARIMRRAGQPR